MTQYCVDLPHTKTKNIWNLYKIEHKFFLLIGLRIKSPQLTQFIKFGTKFMFQKI